MAWKFKFLNEWSDFLNFKYSVSYDFLVMQGMLLTEKCCPILVDFFLWSSSLAGASRVRRVILQFSLSWAENSQDFRKNISPKSLVLGLLLHLFFCGRWHSHCLVILAGVLLIIESENPLISVTFRAENLGVELWKSSSK